MENTSHNTMDNIIYDILNLQYDKQRQINMSEASSNYRKLSELVSTKGNSDPFRKQITAEFLAKAWTVVRAHNTREAYKTRGLQGIKEILPPTTNWQHFIDTKKHLDELTNPPKKTPTKPRELKDNSTNTITARKVKKAKAPIKIIFARNTDIKLIKIRNNKETKRPAGTWRKFLPRIDRLNILNSI